VNRLKTLYLKLIKSPKVAVDADTICPDIIAGKSLEKVKKLTVFHGNKEVPLSEFFEIRGEIAEKSAEQEIIINGDLRKFKRVGLGMTAGKVVVKGDVGLHLGAQMQGGEIIVEGNVGDWLAAEMKGGIIRIKGSVGSLVGANYPGSEEGMTGGLIHIQGNAGRSVGRKMFRGTIVIEGNVGDFTGAMMKGGTIILYGNSGMGLGYMMRRGTIICLNPEVEILPSFKYDCSYSPTFVKFYFMNLRKLGVKLPKDVYDGKFERYSGDLSEIGKGEILVLKK